MDSSLDIFTLNPRPVVTIIYLTYPPAYLIGTPHFNCLIPNSHCSPKNMILLMTFYCSRSSKSNHPVDQDKSPESYLTHF